MDIDPQQMNILTAFGKAFLLEVEKGEEDKAMLFAKAFLACRTLEPRENKAQSSMLSFI